MLSQTEGVGQDRTLDLTVKARLGLKPAMHLQSGIAVSSRPCGVPYGQRHMTVVSAAAVEKNATMTAEQLLNAVASAERERAASPGERLPSAPRLLLTSLERAISGLMCTSCSSAGDAPVGEWEVTRLHSVLDLPERSAGDAAQVNPGLHPCDIRHATQTSRPAPMLGAGNLPYVICLKAAAAVVYSNDLTCNILSHS